MAPSLDTYASDHDKMTGEESVQPTYSVVIPVFNRASKVGRAIRSVRTAGARANELVEVIVVDDGSSDNSADVAREARADIVIVLPRNLGVTGARNKAIAVARGAFLVILDSDDELSPESLVRTGVHFREKPSTDVLFGACVDRSGCPMHRTGARMGRVGYEELLLGHAPGEFMPVVRREVFVSIVFEERLRGFEGVTWLKIARAGRELYYSPEVLRVYDRSGDDRLCRRTNMLKDARRLAVGWHYFLAEFGEDLWKLRRRVYLSVAVRWLFYERINTEKTEVRNAPASCKAAYFLVQVIRLAFVVVPVPVLRRWYATR